MRPPRPLLLALAVLPFLAGLPAASAAPRAAAPERPAESVEVHARAALGPDDWLAAGTRDGSALIVLRGGEGAIRRVPAPEAGGSVVASPTPLAAGDELLGLAWLAGGDPRGLEVRFAAWTGGGLPGDGAGVSEWGEPETVAGPAAGSQTALAGTVLGDGSVLLVWAAYDGEDDEIVWSLRSGGRWSEPARLAGDNAVPDILPAVAPLGGSSDRGAVVAWNRYDGREYRVVLSRWTAGGWSEPVPAGPPGSLYPELRPADDGAELRYEDARRGEWMALRLDGRGRIADPAPVRVEGPVTFPDRRP